MKDFHKNTIFIFFILLLFIFIFLLNYSYYVNIYDIKSAEQYNLISGFDRNYVNVRLKATQNHKYEKLIIGSSVTHTLMSDVSHEYKIPVIFLINISYKEYYEILKIFIHLHPELKTIYLPLEYHSFLFDRGKMDEIPKYNYKKNMSVNEIIRAYFSFKTTVLSVKYYIQKIKDKMTKDYDGISCFPYNRIKVEPYSRFFDKQIKEDVYYIEKTVDLLQENEIDTVCYILPFNYIYLQDVLTPEKIKIVEDVKRLVTSKGIKIYDFTKKNKYNTQRLDESCLFFDIVHQNELYGNIVYKNLTKQKDDKSVYRIITKENLEECNKLSLKELEEYRQTNKEYIDEYYTYPYVNKNVDVQVKKITLKNSIPTEIIEY